MSLQPLPMSADEMKSRGWDSVDVVFVTGDAYVDHPSFAAALLARVLEADGYRTAVLAQPDWHSCEPWQTFGQPNLAFCISAGNMDSMLNHYTANRKIRSTDAYSPDGKTGLRPDRATLSYCQRAREAYPGVPVLCGGVEASLRRLTHYDYWSDKLKRSIVLDSKADLLVYGMGETALLEIMRRLKNGEPAETIRNVRGTAYRLKQSDDLPEEAETVIHLPSHEETEEDKSQFAKMTRMIYENLNPYLAVTLVQEHALEAVVVNPPSLPVPTAELDRIYALPFTRKPHPSYGKSKIPAWETVKDSVQIHRGCFGGCTFCSITAHQGKFIQSRSPESVVNETHSLPVVSDLGGPSANMYGLGCKNTAAMKICQRLSCLAPTVCPHLNTNHSQLVRLMQTVRKLPNVEKVFIASGVRTDLALLDERYIKELTLHHTGGHLKTAPEYTDAAVLRLMNKPPIENYETFCTQFAAISKAAGKEQYLVPYLMAGFPGTTLNMTAEAAVYLKEHQIRSEQVQEFIPAPFEMATAMYYTGLNPVTGQPVYIPRKLRERRLQKALLMYDDPNNYHDVKSALKESGREDLIGNGPQCLIKPYPPKIMSMRRTSKVKRLEKQNDRDKKMKEERRKLYEEQMQQQKMLRGGTKTRSF
ncbi:MAG: YgiQ family radical SAM protein [Planctomycetaceae bacterium]|jgi:uncharacterized radical SAM protein YgiQ|nr:YgiQ family radical SAM protein [Planctomycetaceae bacterium]